MTQQHIEVGVVLARTALESRWADHAWHAHAVLPGAPAIRAGMSLGADRDSALFYAGGAELTLHGGSTAFYRDNLHSGEPSLWIATAVEDGACRVIAVTADPYEGEALTEAIGSTVDRVPMPEPVRAAIAGFVEAFHVERPFFKRARDEADLELGRGPDWSSE